MIPDSVTESCLCSGSDTRTEGGGALPAKPGAYALVLGCRFAGRVRIGRRGEMEVRPGWYVYAGSALGPGGLRARVGHHLRPAARPRWHIDFLRRHARVRAVWYATGAARREHQWAARIARLPGATVPMARFGSTDCRCAAHLAHFRTCPPAREFERILGPGTVRTKRML